jgi:mannose-6-phosphate isomerase-like protein (cupin superfamily)
MTDEARPLLIRPGEGETIEAAGVEHLFRLTSGQTGGRFAFEEFSLAPGTMGARPHVHHGHDEYFYVLENDLTVHDGTGEVTVGPGHLLAALRGTPHGFRNAGGATVRGLCLYTPAGFEDYFRQVHAAVAAGAVVDDAMLNEFRARFNTTPHAVATQDSPPAGA